LITSITIGKGVYMTLETNGLPAKPFFTCDADGLSILDAAQANNLLSAYSIQPWMDFKNGQGNIIDTIPRKVTARDGQQITVECEDGMVHIDFEEGKARKVTPAGEYVYMGALEERNDGMGYIAVS
jgi:hypothetical protein